jgi:hypothetical protein
LVKEVPAFVGRVEFEGAADGLPQSLTRALGGFAQRRLEFGEGLPDRLKSGL